MLKEPGTTLLILTITTPSGLKEELRVHENDIPEDVVDNFILRHGISLKLKPHLLGQVLEHLKALIAEMEPPQLSFNNVGERLYHKGQLHQARQQQRTKRLQEQQKQEEKQVLTFRPSINKSPELGFSSSTQPKSARVQASPEPETYTFSPKINRMSLKIAEKNSRCSDKFSELYNEAFERKHRKEAIGNEFYRAECSFKPFINRNNATNDVPVVERLLRAREAAQEHIDHKKSILNSDVDPLTGQKLFSPTVGRAPKVPRNIDKLPVGQYLYEQKKELKEPEDLASTEVPVNNRSEKLLLNIKIEKYFEIFQLLGCDGAGNLQTADMNIDALDSDIYKVIEPLIEELISYGRPLQFETFVEAMDSLLLTLSPAEKNLFYKRTRQTVQPSTESSRSRGTNFDGKSMYERHLQRTRDVEMRIRKQQEKNIAKEVSECTFHPTILNYR